MGQFDDLFNKAKEQATNIPRVGDGDVVFKPTPKAPEVKPAKAQAKPAGTFDNLFPAKQAPVFQDINKIGGPASLPTPPMSMGGSTQATTNLGPGFMDQIVSNPGIDRVVNVVGSSIRGMYEDTKKTILHPIQAFKDLDAETKKIAEDATDKLAISASKLRNAKTAGDKALYGYDTLKSVIDFAFMPVSATFNIANKIPGVNVASHGLGALMGIGSEVVGETFKEVAQALPLPVSKKEEIVKRADELGQFMGMFTVGGYLYSKGEGAIARATGNDPVGQIVKSTDPMQIKTLLKEGMPKLSEFDLNNLAKPLSEAKTRGEVETIIKDYGKAQVDGFIELLKRESEPEKPAGTFDNLFDKIEPAKVEPKIATEETTPTLDSLVQKIEEARKEGEGKKPEPAQEPAKPFTEPLKASEGTFVQYPDNVEVAKSYPAQKPDTIRIYTTNRPFEPGQFVDTDINLHTSRGSASEPKYVADIPRTEAGKWLENTTPDRTKQGEAKIRSDITEFPKEYTVKNGNEPIVEQPTSAAKIPPVGAGKFTVAEKTGELTTPPKPVSAKNEQLKSRVFERMQKESPALEGELGYDKMKLKEDTDRAVDLIAKDKQEAFRIAMGEKTSSEVTSTAVNIAMAEKALAEGNNALYARLVKNRSLEQTRRGQEIVAERGSVTDNSTNRYVKELIASRLETLGKKYLGGLETKLKGTTNKARATKIIEKEVARVEAKIKNKTLDMKSALSLLDKLTCL